MNDQLAELASKALESTRSAARPILKKLGFRNPKAAADVIDQLSGSPESPILLPAVVLAAAASSGGADRALNHFSRFVHIAGGTHTLYRRLGECEAQSAALLKILAHSTLATDILVHNPEYLHWLLEETPFLAGDLDKSELREMLRREVSGLEERDAVVTVLRRAQRRELLRIGAAEILSLKPVARIGRELADLADVVLEIALDVNMKELVAKYGQPRNQRGHVAEFCIVGLGKYGGAELNYSSDIDLLFVYDDEGRSSQVTDGADAIDNGEFFTRLGEQLIRSLTEVAADGFLYRVDMRLRPEGRHSPLARSLKSYWVHYESRGELWERQMLLKARLGAGSQSLWDRFRQMLRPFIFPAHFSVSPREEIRKVKYRIETEIQPATGVSGNIKLRPGGIRDIEFIVQCLQLLSGRNDATVRSANTLEAISNLSKADSLDAGEAAHLTEAYLFLRRLENLLQIETDRPVYELPEEVELRRGLAFAMGLENSRQLEATLKGHTKRVRAIFDRLFYGESDVSADFGWVLDAPAGAPQVEEFLSEMGFAAPASSHGFLVELVQAPMMTQVGRQRLAGLLPELLASLSASPDPDAAAQRLSQLMSAYGAPNTFIDLLKVHPNFRRAMTLICGSSQYLTDLMSRDPALFDWLVSGAATDNAKPALLPVGKDHVSIRRSRNSEILRIGTEDLLKLSTSDETFNRLSDLADMVVAAVYQMTWRDLVRRRGKPRTKRGADATFACIGAGKYGSRELNFGSDLDLFFVYEGEGVTGTGVDNQQFFAELAVELGRQLGEVGYEVDARLRPEGRSAPMVINLSGYQRYLKNRGGTWVRMALTRARVVAGDPSLCNRVMRSIQKFVYSEPLEPEAVREMRDIRRRMEPVEKRGSSLGLDIKRCPGGIVDVEFITQILAVARSAEHGLPRQTGTRITLQTLIDHDLVPEGSFLLAAHALLRDVEKGFRMTSNQPRSELPGGRDLEILARALGMEAGSELKVKLDEMMGKTRQIFEGVFGALSKD